MTADELSALLAIALQAAFADGTGGGGEREGIRRALDALGAGGIDAAALYRDVLAGRTTSAAEAAKLASPALRRLAFELAVGACDADGLRNDAETRFLAALGGSLGLSLPEMAEPAAIADALATLPLDAAPLASAAGPAVAPAPAESDALDAPIASCAIAAGALERLPNPMAALAIIALQMKIVYRAGKAHGHELDRGEVKDFLVTAGVGLAGQYLRMTGRMLIDGRSAAAERRAANGAAGAFATTWSLGQLARRYYAGGRTMDAPALKDALVAMLGQAEALQPRHEPQIEALARTVDVARIVQLVRDR